LVAENDLKDRTEYDGGKPKVPFELFATLILVHCDWNLFPLTVYLWIFSVKFNFEYSFGPVY